MTAATRFAAAYAVLTAAHEVADHWVQVHAQASAKGRPGPAGARACAAHVATYTATQALALVAARSALGLRLPPGRAAAALAVSAVTHYVADRSNGHWADHRPRGVAWLAARTGHTPWLHTDRHAAYLMDQAWHKGWVALAAAVAAGGAP